MFPHNFHVGEKICLHNMLTCIRITFDLKIFGTSMVIHDINDEWLLARETIPTPLVQAAAAAVRLSINEPTSENYAQADKYWEQLTLYEKVGELLRTQETLVPKDIAIAATGIIRFHGDVPVIDESRILPEIRGQLSSNRSLQSIVNQHMQDTFDRTFDFEHMESQEKNNFPLPLIRRNSEVGQDR